MKILSITDTETLSGAGIAALRIQRALNASGADVTMAVARRGSSTTDVEELLGPAGRYLHAGRRVIMKGLLRAAGANSNEVLSANLLPTGLQRRINASPADIVHLHWVGQEMLRLHEIALIRKPLVWTLHDEWFVLGLEHYAACGDRPGVVVERTHARRSFAFRCLDGYVRRRKAAVWQACKPEIVCPSRWLALKVLATGMIPRERLHVIANTLPLDVFVPGNRVEARTRLGLPVDRPVVGMGALKATDDPRKGFTYLRDAIVRIAFQAVESPPVVLVFGAQSGAEFPLATHYVGTVRDDKELARLYSAMDVFVCPSRQENLPNTIAESLACGVPTVAFDVGGISDLVTHRVTGYLARPFDTVDLARGVIECMEPDRNRVLSQAARARAVERLSGGEVAARYTEVFRHAMNAWVGRPP